MKIKFLGTGSISSLANNASLMINDNILLDVGPGIYKILLNCNINLKKIKYVLITHLHGDHTFDIPFLLYGIYSTNKNQELIFIGPKKLKRKIKILIKEAFPLSYKTIYNSLNIKFLDACSINDFNIGKISISSFPVVHGKLKECYGYILDEKVAITGDTSLCNSVIDISKRLDYLICDTTRQIGDNLHMGIDNIKTIADNKDLKIITTHMSINSREKLNKTIFPYNNVIVAKDLFDIEI